MTKSNVGQDAYCSQAQGVVHLLRKASQKPEVVFESRNIKKQRKREGGKEREIKNTCVLLTFSLLNTPELKFWEQFYLLLGWVFHCN